MAICLNIKLKLILQAPLLAVGTLRTENFFSSLDYLPGGVLRAALAAALLEGGGVERLGGDKLNWVTPLTEEERGWCSYPHLFDEFSDMRIGDATLYGARFAPMTSYICKKDLSHPAVDYLCEILDGHFKRVCPECSGPVDRLSGWFLDGRKIEGVYRTISRTAINPYLGVAADERLFTCHCLEMGEAETPTELHAVLRCSPEAAKEWENFFDNNPRIYAGRYTSSGLGAMDVKVDACPSKVPLEERLEAFGGMKSGRLQVPLTAWSDIYLPMEDHWETPKADREEAIQMRWSGLLGLPEKSKLVRCFTDYRLRSGFSTKEKSEKRRAAKWIITKGSVFVLNLPDIQVARDWLKQKEEEGLGDNAEHGFGRVLAADPIHSIKGVGKK